MKNDLFKILFGLIVGIFLTFLFKCENNKIDTTIKTKVEYKTKKVYIPKDSIIYSPSKEEIVYIKQDSITKYITIYKDKKDSSLLQTNKYSKDFLYKDSNIVINGNLEVIGNKVYEYNLNDLNISYKEKIVTNTIIESKRYNNILLGSNINFTTQNFTGVNFNLTYKTKKDFMIEGGYTINFVTNNFYTAGVKIPLFHKKK